MEQNVPSHISALTHSGVRAFLLPPKTPVMRTQSSPAGAGVSLSLRRLTTRPDARRLSTSALDMTGPFTLRYQRSTDGGPGFGREFELQQVMAEIGRWLAAISRINTREYDDHRDVIEAAAAPYAIALYYEVRRLETLLRHERFLRKARAIRRRVPLGGTAL